LPLPSIETPAVLAVLIVGALAAYSLGIGSSTASSSRSSSSALSSFPSGGVFNTPGNLLITDQFNNRVIEVNPAGDIVWQYSQGLNTASFASRLPNNDTLIADAGHSRIVEINAAGQTVSQYFTNDSANSIPTPYPSNAVRLANGDTSIADTLNDRIVIVNNANQTVYQYGKTDAPGNGEDQLNWPYSCYVIGDYTGQTVPPGINQTG